MFGLEIRKLNNTNLFRDVDIILRNNEIVSGKVDTDTKAQALGHAIQNMIRVDRYFDVCTIRDCAELCSMCISEERMSLYRSIHCIHWNAMLPDFRQKVIAMVLDDFREILNPVNA